MNGKKIPVVRRTDVADMIGGAGAGVGVVLNHQRRKERQTASEDMLNNYLAIAGGSS